MFSFLSQIRNYEIAKVRLLVSPTSGIKRFGLTTTAKMRRRVARQLHKKQTAPPQSALVVVI
jgi:hypothetical protein